MERKHAVFSALGADRVGIVDDLAGLIEKSGGNIEESKMAVLGTDFAVIMLVSLDAPVLEGLTGRIPDLEAELGLKIGLKATAEPLAMGSGRPYILETVSLDGRGIVHAVSSVLRKRGINIEELETRTEMAPLTGAPLFRLRANLVLGPGVHAQVLRRELEEIDAAQDLDVTLKPLVVPGVD